MTEHPIPEMEAWLAQQAERMGAVLQETAQKISDFAECYALEQRMDDPS